MRAFEMQIMDAFFAAMAFGYAQGASKSHIEALPGSKMISSVHGEFKVVDLYYTTEHSDKSTGHTIISYENQPVWVMYYGGWYAKAAVPFLKECLHRAYVTERKFYGGRGPLVVHSDTYTYTNIVRNGDFSGFDGDEVIIRPDGRPAGHHWYKGMVLINS